MHCRRIFAGRHSLFTLAVACSSVVTTASATRGDNVAVQKVLTGLDQPRGVAVRAGSSDQTYEVFVAESGAGRIMRLANGGTNTTKDVITGFSTRSAGDEGFRSTGVTAVTFLDATRLVVTGGDDDGRAFVRLYELLDNDSALSANEHKQNLSPPADGEQAPLDIRGFRGLARTQPNDRVANLLIVAGFGDKFPARLWKIPVRANTLGDMKPFGPPQPNDHADAGGGIAVGNHGYVVMANGPTESSSRASGLKFLNPVDGHVALEIETELTGIVALGYSPSTGNLYAATVPAGRQKGGGVYRLDDAGEIGAPASHAVKIADVPRPTALAFGPDNALYVTALGERGNDESSRGELLRITGEL